MSSPSGVTGPAGHQLNSGNNSSLGAPMPQQNESTIDTDVVMDHDDPNQITWRDDVAQGVAHNATLDAGGFEQLPFADNMDEDPLPGAADPQQSQQTTAGNPHTVQQSVESRPLTEQTEAPEARTDDFRVNPLAFIEARLKEAEIDGHEAKTSQIANKKQRELDAQKPSGQAESSKRPRSDTSPTGSPIGPQKKPMNTWGKASVKPIDDDMNVDTPPEINFGSMMENIRILPCAVKIVQKTGVIGNPTTVGATPGMTIRLHLDAGKQAMPSIGLDFPISKTGVDSKSEDDYNRFTVG